MALRALKTFRVRELSSLPTQAQLSVAPQLPNPFLPHKNPDTGRWAPPKYSLRRQAELIKSAKSAGLVHLLPVSQKYSLEERVAARVAFEAEKPRNEWWEQKVNWVGELHDEKEPPKDKIVAQKRGPSLNVKPMDGLSALKLYAGRKRMFKGHKWERTKAARDRKTRMMMSSMPKRIARFRKVHSHVYYSHTISNNHRSGISTAGQALSSHGGVPKSPSYRSRILLPALNTLIAHEPLAHKQPSQQGIITLAYYRHTK